MNVDIRQAAGTDLVAIHALLTESNLPADGVGDALAGFVVAYADGRIVGVAGVEAAGTYGLLRSTAVAPAWRGRGVARRLVERLTSDASALGLRALYLLTTTAERYFQTIGFTTRARDSVPDAIRATAEFSRVCPVSATVMCLPLAPSALLQRAHEIGERYMATLPERFVGSEADYHTLVDTLGGPLQTSPRDPIRVIEQMARDAEPGLVATAGPRWFGFVNGGALPVAVAADWLTASWDQHAFSFATSPAAAATEEVVRRWLADLLGLAPDVSLGLVTGATMANFTCLAAARHAELAKTGWDAEALGLFGAPPLTVIASEESHATIFASLQMLGLGRTRVTRVATDQNGRMRADALARALRDVGPPLVVCAQAGSVNTGAFDPLPDIVPLVHDANGWLHVDGAFGAWAAASRRHRHLCDGVEQADSLSVDAHKWLNVPYDCGCAFTRHPDAHRAAMTLEASYYARRAGEGRSNHHFVPESSRRARGFTVYAALRSLGREGVEQLVDRCCALARRMADRLAGDGRVRVLNDVVLNQVLVRFEPPDGGDADTYTADIIRRVQQDGTCWLGGSDWHGMHVMRFSVVNWATTEEDIDRSAAVILRSADAARAMPATAR